MAGRRLSLSAPPVLAAALAAALAAVIAGAEAISWRAARRARREDSARADGAARDAGPGAPPLRESVVVLGYGNRGEVLNGVNRWRLRIALRSMTPGAQTTLIASGGAVSGASAEAQLLARHARAVLGWEGPLLIEGRSRTTWENIEQIIPLVEDAQRIVIASSPLHAERARAFLQAQRPDLAARLAPAANHRFGERMLWKPAEAVVGLEGLRRARRDGQIPSRRAGRAGLGRAGPARRG